MQFEIDLFNGPKGNEIANSTKCNSSLLQTAGLYDINLAKNSTRSNSSLLQMTSFIDKHLAKKAQFTPIC